MQLKKLVDILAASSTQTATFIIMLAAYGFWTSPITPELVAQGTPKIGSLVVDGDDLYWSEMRPANKGRITVVLRSPDGTCIDVTPPDFNTRAFVHEYGGGAFTAKDGIVYSCCAADNAVYVIEPGKPPKKLTEGQAKDDSGRWIGTRFAGLQVTHYGLLAVGETHNPDGAVDNFLAMIDLANGSYRILASGYDFYSSPVLNKEQNQIAWLCWNQPNMPWTTTELWIGDLTDAGEIENPNCIAGQELQEGIVQPSWSNDSTLYFVTDRDGGWWNLHRHIDGKIKNICPMEAEAGDPLWVFGRSSYAFLGETIISAYTKNSVWYLIAIDTKTLKRTDIPCDGVFIHQVFSNNDKGYFIESYADNEDSIIQISGSHGYPKTVLVEKKTPVDNGYISIGQHIAFPSKGHTAYGFYYPPKNKDFIAPEGDLPPLIVTIHGGPTGQTNSVFSLARQFWTSRGFALLDINYGGSTGYGRTYRQLLNGQWGVVDVDDCVAGAQFLTQQGLVDDNRLFIRGGSAGGYTTLAALAFRDVFKGGASYFGVADITALFKTTHKFERYYNDELIGPYPEEADLWEARSPINAVDKINVPLILFQGEDDSVVPKEQAVMIFEALKKRGLPVELHLYPGEDHGFRQASTIIDTLTKEVAFYQQR